MITVPFFFRVDSDDDSSVSWYSRFSVVSSPKSASCDVNMCSKVSGLLDGEGESEWSTTEFVFFSVHRKQCVPLITKFLKRLQER